MIDKTDILKACKTAAAKTCTANSFLQHKAMDLLNKMTFNSEEISQLLSKNYNLDKYYWEEYLKHEMSMLDMAAQSSIDPVRKETVNSLIEKVKSEKKKCGLK
jgi:phosphoserine phosphatase